MKDTGAVPALDLAPRGQETPVHPFNVFIFIWWSLVSPQALRSYARKFLAAKDLSTTPGLIEVVWQAKPLIAIQIVVNATFSTIVVWLTLGFGRYSSYRDTFGLIVTSLILLSVLLIVVAATDYFIAGGSSGTVEAAGLFISAGFLCIVSATSFSFVPHPPRGTASALHLGLLVAVLLSVVSGILAVRGGVVRHFMALFLVLAGCLFAWRWRAQFEGGEMIWAILFAGRIPEWLFAAAFGFLSPRIYWGHLAWLPLPGRKRTLERWLEQDWEAGVLCVNEILLYSLQFLSVMAAVKSVVSRSSEENLLPRVARLSTNPTDWGLIRSLSSVVSIRVLPLPMAGLWAPVSQPETPAQLAFAGFWYWHDEDSSAARKVFAQVRSFRCGEELYAISAAIFSAEASGSLEDLAQWQDRSKSLEALDTSLRFGTLQALASLRRVSIEITGAFSSSARLNRSAALNRAAGELQGLIDSGGSFCPSPEWVILKRVARSWLEIVARSAGKAGEAVLRQPVGNPYEGYAGLPVTGSVFVGRQGTMHEIETRWATGNVLIVVILYGHRRMGKTSILRNLEHMAGPEALLVYLDMQDTGWIDHIGQLLLDLAEAVHRRAIKAGLDAGPLPVPERYVSLGEARRELNAFLDHLDPQMTGLRLILAVDEFELIEKGMAEGRIDPGFLPYLRAIHQRYRWLALIFGGLHTLDELGRDYRSAFYGQAEHIRVGYLTHDDVIQLITQPHQDFALEYSPELREELFRLTYGQPYLIQRLCWELVNRWNERFLAVGEATPRTLEMGDLVPVLTDDLYAGAAYYFDGVWSNVSEAERRIMEVMASRETVWRQEELAAAAGEEDLEATLRLLRRHDVIIEEEGNRIRFASELMRRWVARQMQADIGRCEMAADRLEPVAGRGEIKAIG